MTLAFIIAAAVALVSTLLVITCANAVHALLYLIVSLLSMALIFFVQGAPLVAALEVIVYAGAIIVLFVFVVILLNAAPGALAQEARWLQPSTWIGPVALALILLAELCILLTLGRLAPPPRTAAVGPVGVGLVLFGPYLLGVELASMLLLAGLVGAFHLGRRGRVTHGGRS